MEPHQVLVLEDRDGGDWVVCRQAHFNALEDRIARLEDLAREVLKWLPDDLPSNELYAAVDNLAGAVPVQPAAR